MRLGSFKFIHVVKLDATPSILMLADTLMGRGGEFGEAIEEQFMAIREQLDALRRAVEADESRRQEIARLKQERATYEADEATEDAAEAEEDRLHADELARLEAERNTNLERIAELERQIADGEVLTKEESAELAGLIERLNADSGTTE